MFSKETFFTILVLVAGLIVIFLFFIKPQQEQRKNEDSFLKDLKRGDRIVTLGGIHGRIVDMNDTQVLLAMEDGTSQILFAKRAISFEATKEVYGPAPEVKKKGKKKKKIAPKKK